MQKIVVASKNNHKIAEFQAILSPWKLDVTGLPQGVPESPEHGSSFEANAIEKAVFYSSFVNGWVLADDSGLCVDALEGRPGIFSARYAGVHGDDAANRQKLLADLREVPDAARSASFACAIAVFHRGLGEGLVVRSDVLGSILTEEHGEGGFGYDPLFYHPESGKTFSELSAEQKNRLSHRAKAVERLMAQWKGEASYASLSGE